MSRMQSNDPIRSALVRLTANEKECLRRRLLPQTAKGMAIDLGISAHAVEKRLKMARTKLGVSSSLAAARLLAAEQYQSLVPQVSELPGRSDVDNGPRIAGPLTGTRSTPPLFKGFVMLVGFLLISLVAQDASAPVPQSASPSVQRMQDAPMRKVGMDEAAAFIRIGFREKDTDHSEYLDPGEASAMEPRDQERDPSLSAAPPAGSPDPAAERKWMAKLDTDRDGKVSEAEYVSYLMPWILWQGVPANWHPMK